MSYVAIARMTTNGKLTGLRLIRREDYSIMDIVSWKLIYKLTRKEMEIDNIVLENRELKGFIWGIKKFK